MREFFMTSTGGCNLRCGLWMPRQSPRAMVQLVHGVAEHVERYDKFGRFLAEHGIAMVGDDHMGHGKSVGSGDVPGFFPSGWDGAVEDEYRLMTEVRRELPHTPYVLLGHSMGSFLTRTFLYTHPDADLSGVILSGTGWIPAVVLVAGLHLCERERRRVGENQISEQLQRIVFENYNRPFRPNRTDRDWTCSDPAAVETSMADPYCSYWPTVGLAADMLGGIRRNQKAGNLAAMDHNLPVLFFSGEQDPVGSMGRGVRRTVRAFEKAGMKQVTCHLYAGRRHEMLQEVNREEVYADVLRWLNDIL